jgi:hypothetical protein
MFIAVAQNPCRRLRRGNPWGCVSYKHVTPSGVKSHSRAAIEAINGR